MLKMQDIRPKPSSFTLAYNNKTYRLRAVSLEDEIWMNQTFGERLNDVFKELQMEHICRIVFRLMESDCRPDFASTTVKIINETGDEVSETMGGYRLLMAMMTGGPDEKIHVINALMETIGLSRPVAEKIVKDDADKTEKKSPPKKPTGRKS